MATETYQYFNNLLTEYKEMYNFVQLVANDYVELSHDKIEWQRNDYIKRAQEILEKIHD